MTGTNLIEKDAEPIDVLNARTLKSGIAEMSLRDEIINGLTFDQAVSTASEEGFLDVRWTKRLPTSESIGQCVLLYVMIADDMHPAVLYEGNGIDLYEAITRDSRYYLYRDELDIFQQRSDEIVSAHVCRSV